MRKIIVSEFISLDGVVEEPRWTMKYWNDEVQAFKFTELMESGIGALLLGRKTYEGFAEAWPNQLDEAGYGQRMNDMPKYVASTTLSETAWNAELLKGDTIAAVRELKEQDGEDLLVFGSTTLARTLLEHKLVDMYHFVLYPVVLGRGKRLFDDSSAGGTGVPAGLELVEAKPTSSGAVIVTYRVTEDEVDGIPA